MVKGVTSLERKLAPRFGARNLKDVARRHDYYKMSKGL